MSGPPTIFGHSRRRAVRLRMRHLQATLPDAPRYIMADMVEDVIERLQFLRHEPARALIIGDWTGNFAGNPPAGCQVTQLQPEDGFDEEQPFAQGGFDLIASLGTLDTLNDLPGALIHLRHALAPGGLMIASFMAAGCLPRMRAAMLVADGDRPAGRMHPLVDVRGGGQLLQRCGFADPVIDARGLDVRFSSLSSLLADLRAQGLTSALASPASPLNKSQRAKAEAAFMDGQLRAAEHFEIITLSGWKR